MKITTRNIVTETTDTKLRSLQAEINLLNSIKFSANPTKSRQAGDEKGESREAERQHTTGSLLNKLRKSLTEAQMLKTFDGSENSWASIQASDFVELKGMFHPNPFIAWLNSIEGLLQIAIPFNEMISVNAPSGKSGGKKAQNAAVQSIIDVQKVLNSFHKDIEREGTRLFLVDLVPNSSHKAIVTIFVDYLRDKSTMQLADKEFFLLGKVIHNLAKEEKVDLLSGTGLGGMSDTVINNLTNGLNTTFSQSQWNLPKIVTKISAPALQIIPIAIYV